MGGDSFRIGQWGEKVASEYLKNSGYTILECNFHTANGELDIIAISPEARLACLVFVEVKTRTSREHGYPEDAISKKKWNHLHAAIQCYLASRLPNDIDWCLDVISIIGHPNHGEPQIQHYESVVMLDERE